MLARDNCVARSVTRTETTGEVENIMRGEDDCFACRQPTGEQGCKQTNGGTRDSVSHFPMLLVTRCMDSLNLDI